MIVDKSQFSQTSPSVKKQKSASVKKEAGKKGTLGDIALAVEAGHITREEGRALNPSYTRGNSQSISRQLGKARKKIGKELTQEEAQQKLSSPKRVKASEWGEVWD